MKKSEVLYEFLTRYFPGGWDPELDDKVVYGPRGGIRGVERGKGLQLSPWAGRVVSRGGIRHGYRWYYVPGFGRVRAKIQRGGRVLPPEPAICGMFVLLENRWEEISELAAAGDYDSIYLLAALEGAGYR